MAVYIIETCSLHKDRKAIYSRNSLVETDEEKVLMCEGCRNRLLEIFEDELERITLCDISTVVRPKSGRRPYQ